MVENEQDFIGIANTIAYQLSSQIWVLCTVACCATHVEFSPEWVMDIFGMFEGSIKEGNIEHWASSRRLMSPVLVWNLTLHNGKIDFVLSDSLILFKIKPAH